VAERAVSHLFADFATAPTRPAGGIPDLRVTSWYRAFLLAIALLPMAQLGITVERAQLLYAVMGSLFMPFLALTLLLMNTRRGWVRDGFVSGWITHAALVATFTLFTHAGRGEIHDAVRRLRH
jgi:hypothetical protein